MKRDIKFHPITDSDLDKIVEIERRVMPFGWNLQTFQLCLYNGAFEGWKVETADGVIGYCNLYYTATSARLLNLCIDLPFQRRGFGTQLLTFAVAQCRTKQKQELFLEVRMSNHVAQNLYRSVGFRVVEQWYDYYESAQGREHAYVFALPLIS